MITTHHIKTFALSVLLMLIPFSVQAQDNERALAKAVEEVVLMTDMNPKVVNEFIEEIYQKHGKKSAYLTSRIAKAYYLYSDDATTKQRNFGRHEPDTAFVYINRAIAIDPKYPAPYILASEIVKYEPNYGERSERLKKALEWLNRGISANPTDSSLYDASARLLAYTDVDAAVSKLQELKEKDPNFPLDLKLARIFYDIYDIGGSAEERGGYLEKMVSYYDKVNFESLTKGDIGSYAMGCYFLNRFEQCFDIASKGLLKYPEDFGLNKFCLGAAVRIKKWDECLSAVNRIKTFNPDKMDFAMYIQYGTALVGRKEYDKAIEQFEYVLESEKVDDRNKQLANNAIRDCMDARVEDYTKDNRYDEAINMYYNFISERRQKGKLDGSMLFTYSGLFQSKAKALKLEGEEKNAVLSEADRIYAEAIKEFPDNDLIIRVGTYYRLYLNWSMDAKNEKGNTLPHAEKLISLLGNKTNLSNAERQQLVYGYTYMMIYGLHFKNDKKMALMYADKILDVDPTNEDALKIYQGFNK